MIDKETLDLNFIKWTVMSSINVSQKAFDAIIALINTYRELRALDFVDSELTPYARGGYGLKINNHVHYFVSKSGTVRDFKVMNDEGTAMYNPYK